MKEDMLVPVETGRKDKEGNDLYNLTLKTKVDKATGVASVGLAVGDSITVEKIFEGGLKTKYDYSIKVIYKGKTCSFFLPERFYEEFKNCGGIGDKVKIIAFSYDYKFKDKEGVQQEGKAIGYKFELVGE